MGSRSGRQIKLERPPGQTCGQKDKSSPQGEGGSILFLVRYEEVEEMLSIAGNLAPFGVDLIFSSLFFRALPYAENFTGSVVHGGAGPDDFIVQFCGNSHRVFSEFPDHDEPPWYLKDTIA